MPVWFDVHIEQNVDFAFVDNIRVRRRQMSYSLFILHDSVHNIILYWNGQNLCVHQLLRLYLRGTVSRLGTGISARRRYQRG